MEDKVVDFIVEMAQVSESKVSIEELMASLQEDDDDEAGANDADADAGAEAGMDSGKADDK
jgi:hypothetical protein